jgi:hypothetical protein
MSNWKQITQGTKLAVVIAVENKKHEKYACGACYSEIFWERSEVCGIIFFLDRYLEMMRNIASKHSEYQFGYLDTEEYPNVLPLLSQKTVQINKFS